MFALNPAVIRMAFVWGMLAVLSPAALVAQISGSAHDFSVTSWNTSGEICQVCHVPHSKIPSNPVQTLLWNRGLSQQTYQIYTSPRLVGDILQPQTPSQLCLGCHDGTVALDAFGGQMGTTYLTGRGNLTTDLRGSHPVSIEFTHKGVHQCGKCHSPHNPQIINSALRFYDHRVECPTCHEPHSQTPSNPGGEFMLRITNSGSELCLACHHK